MSARFKGRRREVERLLFDVTTWARSADNVDALVLVGSHARSQARMGSDVDLTNRAHEGPTTHTELLCELTGLLLTNSPV